MCSSDLAIVNGTGSLSSIQTQVNNLTTTVNGLSTTVSGLSTTVGTQGTTLSNLSSEYSTLNSTVTTQGTSLTSLTNTVNSLNSTVTTTSNAVTGLTTTVNNLSSTVTGLNSSVTGLNTTVNNLSSTVAGHTSSIASLTTSVNSLNSTVSNQGSSLSSLTSTVNTDGTSITTLNNEIAALTATVNSLSAGQTTAAFVDAQTPSGTVNGTNTTFTLAGRPAPTGSLEVYRNGLLQTSGVDYTVAGTTITFLSVSIPQSGDLIETYYRTTGTGPAANFSDDETPGGSINGTNLAFTLLNAPSPALSLKLYKNGVLLQENGDYTLSGNNITFASTAVTPQSGDSLAAYYRH